MNHTIVFFEIPSDDPTKLKDFYGNLFGWRIEKVDGMDYWFVHTTSDGTGLTGGMMKRQSPQQPVLNYVGVESIDTHTHRIQQLGGSIVVPKQAVPGMGWFAVATDPDGNPFAIWQEDSQAK
ncbi:MAG: VOC family protein [Chloroflexi bacterium]|nr:VOC family protein [Chloroflexota bacterium]